MKQLKNLILTLMMTCGIMACSDNDEQFNGDGAPERNFVEHMVPVVNPQNESRGVITLRFYNDMPHVAYVDVSNFQSMMFPGTTIQTYKTADNQ